MSTSNDNVLNTTGTKNDYLKIVNIKNTQQQRKHMLELEKRTGLQENKDK